MEDVDLSERSCERRQVVTPLPSTISKPNDDDNTNGTTPLCEDDDELSSSRSRVEEDTEADDISSLGGMEEEGFAIDFIGGSSQDHYNEALHHSSHREDAVRTPPQDSKSLRRRPLTPELMSSNNHRPSFNDFLNRRTSDTLQDTHFIRRVGSNGSLSYFGQLETSQSQQEEPPLQESQRSSSSFVQERASTFRRNVQFLASGGLSELIEDDEELGFFQARARTFGRNLQTIKGVFRSKPPTPPPRTEPTIRFV